MQPGDHIRDFILERKLGQGGMGEVWLAQHALLGKAVAIKAMDPVHSGDAALRERFLSEARAMAVLEHPRVVWAQDFFEEGGRLFLVMPFVDGQSLEHRMEAARGPLPMDEVLRLSADILEALGHAHERGIIHRDVKPSNIMIDKRGRACLTDFGIALMMGETRRTRTGQTVGTPDYMSPEQIEKPRDVDYHTDIYSFGAMLYEMLTGEVPFRGESDWELAQKIIREEPPPLPIVRAKVPGWVVSILLKAMRKNPLERFMTCEEMRAALAAGGNPRTVAEPRRGATIPETLPPVRPQGVGTHPPSPQPPPISRLPAPPPAPPARPPSNRSGVAVGIGVAAMIAVVVIVVTVLSSKGGGSPGPIEEPSEPSPAPQYSSPQPDPAPPPQEAERPPDRAVEPQKLVVAGVRTSTVMPDYYDKRTGVNYHFGPEYLHDGNLRTCWQAKAKATGGRGEWVVLSLASESSVSEIRVGNGFQRTDALGDLFEKNCRIRRAKAVFKDGATEVLTFGENERGMKNFTFPAHRTDEIQIEVEEVWRGSQWPDLSVSEIEVYGS